MAFSVMPRRAVTAARRKTPRPVNTWTGRRAFRRWDARPSFLAVHRQFNR